MENYVTVELNGIAEQDWVSNIGDKCKFVGLDTRNPYLQIGPYIFRGEYVDNIGTHVVFEENTENGERKLQYKCNTMKKLKMERIFIKKKPTDDAEEDCIPQDLTNESITDTKTQTSEMDVDRDSSKSNESVSKDDQNKLDSDNG